MSSNTSHAAIVAFAMTGGAMIAMQAPINAKLRTAVGAPLLSAALSFLVGTVLLWSAVAATGAIGGLRGASAAPWWAWLGGFAGAILVTATLVAAPRIGVLATFVAVIFGQVVTASLIDRFGWFEIAARALSPERIVALVLLAIALVLLLRG